MKCLVVKKMNERYAQLLVGWTPLKATVRSPWRRCHKNCEVGPWWLWSGKYHRNQLPLERCKRLNGINSKTKTVHSELFNVEVPWLSIKRDILISGGRSQRRPFARWTSTWWGWTTYVGMDWIEYRGLCLKVMTKISLNTRLILPLDGFIL